MEFHRKNQSAVKEKIKLALKVSKQEQVNKDILVKLKYTYKYTQFNKMNYVEGISPVKGLNTENRK